LFAVPDLSVVPPMSGGSAKGSGSAAEKPLTCAAYIGDPLPEAFVEPVALGDALPEMPLFLTPDDYVPISLEATYQAARQEFPAVWRDVLGGTA
jgi:hypothetical protein